MKKLNKKATERTWVAKIIDELKGKNSNSSPSNVSYDDDNDKQDYELFENDSKTSFDDTLGKEIRCQERKLRHK